MNKAGWKTSEFWLTISMQVISLLVMFGVIASEDTGTITDAVKDIITSAFALISSAIVLWKYIQGRVDLKMNKS